MNRHMSMHGAAPPYTLFEKKLYTEAGAPVVARTGWLILTTADWSVVFAGTNRPDGMPTSSCMKELWESA
jgi:hypothetical protein